jgi:hypothetical protein
VSIGRDVVRVGGREAGLRLREAAQRLREAAQRLREAAQRPVPPVT